MPEADEKTEAQLPIDPQPRRDLEVPPMISKPQPEGVSSVQLSDEKPTEVANIFATLDFANSQ